MKKYLFKSKSLLFLNLLFAILLSIIEISFAFVLGNIVDVSVTRNGLGFKKVLYIGIVLMASEAIISYLVRIFRGLFIKNSMASLKRDIFDNILFKDIASFNAQNSADYISIINNDTNLIEQDYFINILNSFQYISLFVLGTYSIFKLNIYIAIAAFAIGFIPIFIPMLFQKETGRRKKEYSNSLSNFTTKIKDIFSGFEVIKSFNIEEKIREDFNSSNNAVENKKYSSSKMEATVNSLSEFFGSLVFFVPLGLGTYLVLKGNFTVGGMLTSVQLMNYIVNPILNYSAIVNKIKGIKPINEKIEKIVEKNKVSDKGLEKNSLKNSIQFKNLSFSYNEDRQILQNINLNINKGEKVAIVGRSGSGKSTLLKLVLRYYENYNGEILIDNIENRNLKISSTYELISIIQQNVFMFDDSIEANIALYGDYTDDEINKAIINSGLLNLIETLPHGSKSSVGENGSNLSGGEKQRISIARALIKNTPVLLLDEATASLDSETSYEIESSILDIEDLTSIVVTHKLNQELLKRYDKIVVMENGNIIEEGNFYELIDKKGFFYNLYNVEKTV
ncbi:ABC transporter ATP-binding protein [Sporanaerobacter acetigenes]|uniref:ATP-binding cassette, subfamily C n=1 Tax=Sporanaerobacter acetigenes DSM 13106 TaxID=1123281 RepID=A0A1M5W0Y8_9FIRM|nr:ABC transporter ATP-binding protein [Sporanaerobacter acetigenes]SHH80843.1 ATP-binding cassette, subfamily C [Sporanaerobacter acetigenes DSM 13106]